MPPWVGASGFALFVAAMTTGRMTGGVLLDRFGRVPVLWGTMAVAGAGVLLVVATLSVFIALWSAVREERASTGGDAATVGRGRL